MAAKEDTSRDAAEDWLLTGAARPRSFGELEARVDFAITLARSAEAAVAEIGATALDAAAQSQRAATLAERAALAAEEAAESGVEAAIAVGPVPPQSPLGDGGNPAVFPLPSDEDLRLAHFMERADRIVERLRALELLAG